MHNHHTDVNYMPLSAKSCPRNGRGFFNFDEAVINKDIGSLNLATRQLIAVGVAVTTQCSYYIIDHAKRAISASAPKRPSHEPSSGGVRTCFRCVLVRLWLCALVQHRQTLQLTASRHASAKRSNHCFARCRAGNVAQLCRSRSPLIDAHGAPLPWSAP